MVEMNPSTVCSLRPTREAEDVQSTWRVGPRPCFRELLRAFQVTGGRPETEHWISFFAELDGPAAALLSPNRGLLDTCSPRLRAAALRAQRGSVPAACAELLCKLDVLEAHLRWAGQGPFLWGEEPCATDLAGTAMLVDVFLLAWPASLRRRYPLVQRWFEASIASPGFESISGAESGVVCEWPAEEDLAFEARVLEAAAAATAASRKVDSAP
ncbi:unnamed protein product, partial [Polarella glacialis]